MRPAARTRRCARRSSRAASSSRRRSGTAARRSRSSSPSPTPLHSSGLACPGVSDEAIDLIERLLQARYALRLARLDGTRPGTRPEVDGTRPEVDGTRPEVDAGRGGSRGGSPALSPAPPRGEGCLSGGRLIKPASSSPPHQARLIKPPPPLAAAGGPALAPRRAVAPPPPVGGRPQLVDHAAPRVGPPAARVPAGGC